MENKLAIIDGSSLLYRAFYALPPTMTSPDGVPTMPSMVFFACCSLFTASLIRLMSLSPSIKTARRSARKCMTGTKRQESRLQAELVPQFDLILEVMHVMGVAVYSLSGYEGDDVLGTLSARYERNCLSLS